MKDLLFRNKRHREVSMMIRNLWILRKKLLNEIKQKEEEKRNQNKSPPLNGNQHQMSGNIPGGGNELQIDAPQEELTQIDMRSRRLKRPP